MRSTAEWLNGLGLGEYAKTFAENQIDHRVLPELNNDDLRELGIPLGPRKLLLKAISDLRLDGSLEDGSRQSASGISLSESRASSDGERRQLTVMFCDLVGSTALSASMDPEEYRDILVAYRSAVADCIRRYDGLIANYLGDGLLVYFGYPQAHEDDAERAVRSGLDIIEVIPRLNTPGDTKIEVRIGIATGLVVAGDMVVDGASEERAVLGDTPNLAARLQAIAGPNEAVMSEQTRRLVEGRVLLKAMGAQKLKGINEPTPAYRAVAVSETSRFGAAALRGLTTMAGRESELMLLWQRWETARSGEGQTILLSGEPGIGKSRVAEELKTRIGSAVSGFMDYQCSPFHTGSAFHPVIDYLHRAMGLARNDTSQERLAKLMAFVESWLPREVLAGPLLASLLSFPPEDYPALDMSPQRQKVETIGLFVRILEARASEGPILIVFEDVHWIDPSSEELLSALVENVQPLRALCLITHRPEFSSPWSGLGHVTALSLNRLGRAEGRRIVESVAGEKRIPAQLLEQIVERTDGIPLFVEEMAKALLESDVLKHAAEREDIQDLPTDLSIPATLHDLLVARLDRLADVKEVAQTAACLGREFSAELLEAIFESSKIELGDALDHLLHAGLLFRHGAGNQVRYQFKHALVQDAAYESLLVSKRRRLHARIAEALERQFGQTVNGAPERIAQHYARAEMFDRAIPHLVAAGQKALSGSSLLEANEHLTKALELTFRIDDPQTRSDRELEVRTVLGSATMALCGWPAPQVRGIIEPACDLIEQGCGGSDAFMNLWNLWVHHGCRAEHVDGLKVVDRMFAYANARNDPVLGLVSSFTAAMAHLWVGNYEEAATHERKALAAYDFNRDRNLVWHYNHDPKNTLLSWGSNRIWALGYPDKARELGDAAVEHARKVGHPFNLCWTLGNSGIASGNFGDYRTATTRIDELRQIARDQELVFIEAYMASAASCLISAWQGEFSAAYEAGAQAEEIWNSIGGRFWSPVVKTSMARACLGLNRPKEALDLVSEALAQIEETGEFMQAEEVHRIAGLASLHNGADRDKAKAHFQKSLEYCRLHGTRSFELRTSVSLAQVLFDEGDREEALRLLAPVYGQFDEGFDTADLKEAREFLNALS